MQRVQYKIRPKAQPVETHGETTKPPEKIGQNIFHPGLLQKYLLLYDKKINLDANHAI